MAKMRITGNFDNYIKSLGKLSEQSPHICGKAVYQMAKVVTDQVRENIESLTAVPDIDGLNAYREGRKQKLTYSQKDGLKEGLGISNMENSDGLLNVKIGFDGYNRVKTKKYPNGQPNVLIARSAESGSSAHEKQPFVRRAVNQTRKQSLEAGQVAVNEEIQKIMNN